VIFFGVTEKIERFDEFESLDKIESFDSLEFIEFLDNKLPSQTTITTHYNHQTTQFRLGN